MRKILLLIAVAISTTAFAQKEVITKGIKIYEKFDGKEILKDVEMTFITDWDISDSVIYQTDLANGTQTHDVSKVTKNKGINAYIIDNVLFTPKIVTTNTSITVYVGWPAWDRKFVYPVKR